MDRPPRRPPGPGPDRRLRLRLTCAVIGHRGARALWPENTLEGFRRAAALGIDALELDVGLTADGVVVVHHDPCLNPSFTRDPCGAYLRPPGPALAALRADQLPAYDVGWIDPGSPLAAEFPDQQPIDGARIPTLAGILAALPDTAVLIELKAGHPWPDSIALADAVIAVCDAAPNPARLVLQSFESRALHRLRDRRPELALAWLTVAATPDVAARIAADGGTRWSPRHIGLDRAAIARARNLGLSVVPWTVNAAPRMRALIEHGVDGLITDRPDLARAVLRRAAAPGRPVTT